MLNKKRLIVLGPVIILVIVSVLYILIYYKKAQPAVPVIKIPSISTIVPNQTTEQEVLQNLGIPVASNSGVLQYRSTSPARNNEIAIQNNKVSFVKEIVSYKDTIDLKQLNTQYGEANYLYGPDSVNGYYLYYHPEKGIAYLANPIAGAVLEIWHFPVTTFDIFKNNWAEDYSVTPIKNQF